MSNKYRQHKSTCESINNSNSSLDAQSADEQTAETKKDYDCQQ